MTFDVLILMCSIYHIVDCMLHIVSSGSDWSRSSGRGSSGNKVFQKGIDEGDNLHNGKL